MPPRGRWVRKPQYWEKLKTRIREFRNEPTPAEAALWKALRNGKVGGLKFRRQHPIDQYAVDFCCPAQKLVIEVDGRIHEGQIEQDRIRQEYLERKGYRVIRFANEKILHAIESVLEEIAVSIVTSNTPLQGLERGRLRSRRG